MDEDLYIALLEAVWVMRWNEGHTAIRAVLTTEEAEQVCKDIISELDLAGYKIVKKDE